MSYKLKEANGGTLHTAEPRGTIGPQPGRCDQGIRERIQRQIQSIQALRMLPYNPIQYNFMICPGGDKTSRVNPHPHTITQRL